MMFRKALLTFAAFGLVATATVPARAGLIGDSVHGEYLFPNEGTVEVDDGTKTIANGTMFLFNIPSVIVSFAATQITVTNIQPGGFTSAAFNGIDLAFLSGPAITDVTEDASSIKTFADGSVLTYTGSDIELNLQGTCLICVSGERIILDVTTAAATVPEPGSLALLGAGLLALGVRRKRA